MNDLSLVDTAPYTSLAIIKREKDHYLESVSAYGRAAERDRNDVRIKSDLDLFTSAYTTTSTTSCHTSGLKDCLTAYASGFMESSTAPPGSGVV